MRRSRGITLIEILISILIFGIGATSIMTLFPLGMLNIRQAQRYSRSGYLVQSAGADLETRNLLSKASFTNVISSPWTTSNAFTPWPYDPWVQDTSSYGADPIVGPTTFGAYRGDGSFNVHNLDPNHKKPPPYGTIAGQGLPVAYDPLWRMTTPPPAPVGTGPPVGYFMGAPSEVRFASGIGYVRPDPNPGAGNADPSAHGLQRITNFPYLNIYPNANATTVPAIFVSPEDMVLQSNTDSSKGVGNISPIVPDMTSGPANTITGMLTPQYDWKYTWMFTGQRADAVGDSAFVGDIVIFENRPFAVDPATTYFPTVNPGAVSWSVAGETVVEAVFGYTSNVTTLPGGSLGYGTKANHAVLLRWPANMPDPEVRVGSWIADVTYERNAAEDNKRSFTDLTGSGVDRTFPMQRCHWYQIAKRTQPAPATNSYVGDAAVGMREMTVWTDSPLLALTLLQATGANSGAPYHVNAALISPYVVNVFSRTIYTR